MVDLKPPTPDQMTWEVEPYYTSNTIDGSSYPYMVTMTATEASDEETDDEDIMYYFKCSKSEYGSGGWQTSNTHSMYDSKYNRVLTFWVKAKDKHGNETDWSEYATTGYPW